MPSWDVMTCVRALQIFNLEFPDNKRKQFASKAEALAQFKGEGVSMLDIVKLHDKHFPEKLTNATRTIINKATNKERKKVATKKKAAKKKAKAKKATSKKAPKSKGRTPKIDGGRVVKLLAKDNPFRAQHNGKAGIEHGKWKKAHAKKGKLTVQDLRTIGFDGIGIARMKERKHISIS